MNEWIEWPGGECPIAPEQRVDVQFRGGLRVEGLAGNISWRRGGYGSDVVRYRVIAEPTQPCRSPYCECEAGKCTHPGFHDARNEPPATKDTNPKDAIGDKKVPLWLLSPIAKAHWAAGQFAGLVKYGAWNWRKAGVRKSVYLSALARHLDAYTSGEEHDPVDGTHHLGNIMACAAILLDAEAAGKVLDDRPPSVSVRGTYAEIEALMVKLREKYAHLAPRHYTIADTEGQP